MASCKRIEIEFADNGDVNVKVDDVATTVAAAELGFASSDEDDEAASPPPAI